jgi:hypothetical protein
MDGTRRPASAAGNSFTATPSAPGRFKVKIPNTTLGKATARQVIQTWPVLDARELLAKADAELQGSAYGTAEALIRRDKLEDAQKFMDDHKYKERENNVLERVERLQNLHPDHHKLLTRGIRDGHHDLAEPLVQKLESQPGSGARRV